MLADPQSINRVQAAAQNGDVVAQTVLGSAAIEGTDLLPKNITTAVYWLEKVVDGARSKLLRIEARMRILADNRRFEADLRKRDAMDHEYLELLTKQLAYESAFLGLIEIYTGQHGAAYMNVDLTLKYLRLGAACGYPSIQRMLGIANLLGSFGLPRNSERGAMLLIEAARKGDRIAEQLITASRASSMR